MLPFFVLTLACSLHSRGASPDEAAAIALVDGLYAPYLANEDVRSSLFDGPVSTGLRATYARAVQTATGEGQTPPGFDVIVDAQDYSLTNLTLTADDGGRDVTASFKNFGEPTTVRYRLVVEGGQWKVDDVHGRSGWIRAVLTP